MPFIFWPWTFPPFEIPRVWFFHRWSEILLLLGIFSFFLKKRKFTQDKIIFFLVTSFFFLFFLSSLLGADFSKSLWGNYFRADGLFTLTHLIAFSFFLSFFWKDSWRKPLSLVITFSSFFLSFWLIFEAGKNYLTFGRGNIATGGPFGQPVFAAGYLLVTLPFNFFLFSRQKIFLGWLIFGGEILALFLTQTSTAIFGLFLFFFLFFWLFSPLSKKKFLFLILSFLFFLSSLLIFFRFFPSFSPFNPESRTRIYPKVFLGALKRPLFGWGMANVDYAFQAVPYPFFFQHDIYLDKAHSHLLEIFTTTGIFGLLNYLCLILYAFCKLYFLGVKKNNLWSKNLLFAFLLFFFHSQTNVISLAEEVFFWLILGVLSTKKSLKFKV